MFSRAEKLSAATHERSRVKKAESLVRTHGHGVACGSVVGPPNLKSVAAIHREAPTIPPDPPRNGPDVTQIKKIRQHKSKIFCERHFGRVWQRRKNQPPSENSATRGKKKDMQ
jgi:hypothetical protein